MSTTELSHEYIIVCGNQVSKPFASDFKEAKQALQEFNKAHVKSGALRRRLTTPFKDVILDEDYLNTQSS